MNYNYGSKSKNSKKPKSAKKKLLKDVYNKKMRKK
tara:strand:+ start:455 stop:559 length:105 start_codon:yes stop_codon:yes gene_type:complete